MRLVRFAHNVLHFDRPILPEEEDGTFGMRLLVFPYSSFLTSCFPVADIVVKAYFPGTSAFKPGGTVSNYLDVMVEGWYPLYPTFLVEADKVLSRRRH